MNVARRFGGAVFRRTPIWAISVLLCGVALGDLLDLSRGRANHVAPTGLFLACWLAARLSPPRVRRALLRRIPAGRNLQPPPSA